MLKNFFSKTIEQEKNILENNENLDPELYDHLNAIVKLDTNGHAVSYNQVFTTQYGYSEEDFKRPFLDLLLKEQAFGKLKYLENAISGKTQKFHAIGFLKNGNQVDLTITLLPIKNKANIDVFVILKNTAEFQHQQNELHLLQKMREAFDEVEFICNFYYDAIDDYHYFSKQINNLLKIEPEKTFTQSLNHLLRYVHPDDMERVKSNVQTELTDQVGFQIDYRIVRQDQTICLVHIQAEILLDNKGALNGLVGYMQDITNHKISGEGLENEKQ